MIWLSNLRFCIALIFLFEAVPLPEIFHSYLLDRLVCTEPCVRPRTEFGCCWLPSSPLPACRSCTIAAITGDALLHTTSGVGTSAASELQGGVKINYTQPILVMFAR